MGHSTPSAPDASSPRKRPREVRARRPLEKVQVAALGVLIAAGLLMAVSFFFPYWQVELKTSTHPEGLQLEAFVGHFEGAPESPSREQLERSQKVGAATGLALLVLAMTFVRHRWAVLLGLPAIVFPLAALADLAGWLPEALCAWEENAPGCGGDTVPLWGRLEAAGQILVTRPGCGLALSALAMLILAAGLVALCAGRSSRIDRN